jgi:hypothetical protein
MVIGEDNKGSTVAAIMASNWVQISVSKMHRHYNTLVKVGANSQSWAEEEQHKDEDKDKMRS